VARPTPAAGGSLVCEPSLGYTALILFAGALTIRDTIMRHARSQATRRRVVGLVGTGISLAVAGCSARTQTDQSPEESTQPKAYRYFFRDEADALQTAATEIPDDAEDYQILTNTRSEEEWKSYRTNDVNQTRLFNGEAAWTVDLNTEVETIKESAIQRYKNRTNDIQGEDAEIFTETVLDTVIEDTNLTSGPNQSQVVQNTAEYILEESNIEINNYNLSDLRSLIGDVDRNYWSHPMGLLQWEDENGETQVRYAETENRMTEKVVQPEESVYAADVDEEDFVAGGYVDTEPEQWYTALDYEKARQVEDQLADGNEPVGKKIGSALLSAVDDAGLSGWDFSQYEDNGVEMPMPEQASEITDTVVSDSFGTSLQEYVRNPDEDYTRRDFESTKRKFFKACEDNDFTGHYALDGTLDDPEIIKTTEEKVEQIRADKAYGNVASRAVAE